MSPHPKAQKGWPVEVRMIEGARKYRYVIACKCGETHDISSQSTKVTARDGNSDTERRFARAGWTKVDNGKGVCPACSGVAAPAEARTSAIVEEIMEMNAPAKIVTAANPIETETPERSPLALKALPELYLTLGEYYDANGKCYRGGYSDARIAKELGISEVFVATRRKNDFGPLVKRADPIDTISSAFAQVERLMIPVNLPLCDLLGHIDRLSVAVSACRGAIERAKTPSV